MKRYPILGSHVSLKEKDNYLVGSVETMIANDANSLMIFTGSPQTTKRVAVEKLQIPEMHAMLKTHSIELKDLVVHAPYLINLANPINPTTWKFSADFLSREIERCEAIGINILVLHPGSYVKGTLEEGLNQVIAGLDLVTQKISPVKIALETMSGKGTEVGTSIEQLKYILTHVKHPERIGVCLDTCHLNDAGYDLKNWQEIKQTLKTEIGWEKILVFHINDSKNPVGSHKDRHENIGYGTIGFETLNQIVWDEDFKLVPKILETPYLGKLAPYKDEIADLRQQKFSDPFKNAEK